MELTKYVPRLAAFFHRAPDGSWSMKRDDGSEIVVLRFPPRPGGWFKSLFVALPNDWVFITLGMSTRPMQVPPELVKQMPARVELCANVPVDVAAAANWLEEVPKFLLELAIYPEVSGTHFAPLHTVGHRNPSDTQATLPAAMFSVPDGLEMPRLCGCLPGAQLVLGVVPIHQSELQFSLSEGPEALLSKFESGGVANSFNPSRAAVV